MEENPFFWVSQFLGRLHPLLVHFPIGLLVAGLFLELLTVRGKRPGLREGINWLVYLGAISAVLAAILGFILFSVDDYGGSLVDWHQKLGILTALLSMLAAWQLRRLQKNGYQNFVYYRSLLVSAVLSLTVAGHLGANLTHGEDFLSSTFPWNHSEQDGAHTSELLAELAVVTQSEDLSLDQKDRLSLEVRGIFAHNCYKCHGELKQKGELVLETEEGVMKGGENGKIFTVGDAKNSEIIRRLKLPRSDKEAMPGKGQALSNEEIELISLWIDNGAYWSDKRVKVFPEAPLALSKPQLPEQTAGLIHPVDRLVNYYFNEKDIEWPEVVDDKTFIRRAYLDIIGLLPTPEQLQVFENNPAAGKRDELVQTLLADTTNYTQHWISFWNDLLRNDYSGTGFITGGRKQITDWLYYALLTNKPYDQMVSELTNPDEASEGFIKGIEWRGVVNASQRTEMQAAQNISQSLLGVNLKCASCHNSFVSNITLNQAYGFANVFSDTTLEIFRCDKPTGEMSEVAFLYPELGEIEAQTIKEKLKQLSTIMVKPENGRLYRTIVNRLWDRLMGRGIVEPLDDMDQTPWNAELLDWLAADLIDNGYNLKKTISTIMTSKTYQLPSIEYAQADQLRTGKYEFTGPVRRRLSAEQFADAVSKVITPVFYTKAYDPDPTTIESDWIWYREIEVERDILPRPGKRYFRYQFKTPSGKTIQKAEALLSVDHDYKFYLNGKLVSKGNDWRKVQHVNLDKGAQSGTNLIAIEGENEGTVPNPAGLLFAMRLNYEDGSQELINSNDQWKTVNKQPDKNWILPDFDESEWGDVKVYRDSEVEAHWGKLINFSFDQAHTESFARASLVKQNPFLKALGRPSRENVTTSRDDQATLLQALELTNGEFFNEAIEEGATSWLTEYGNNSQALVNQLYLTSFGRQPNDKEKDLMLEVLGKEPGTQEVQDLLWATVLLPEFQFIY